MLRGVDGCNTRLDEVGFGSGAMGKAKRGEDEDETSVFESGTLPTFALAEIERLMLTQRLIQPDFEEEVDENGSRLTAAIK